MSTTPTAGPLKSVFNTTADPKTAGAFTWVVGDLFVIVGLAEDDGSATPTDLTLTGGPTGTLVVQRSIGPLSSAPGTQCAMRLWSIVATNASTGSFSCALPFVTLRYGICAWKFASTCSISTSASDASSTKVVSLTTTGGNSYVIFCGADWAAGASPSVWTPTGHVTDESSTVGGAFTWDIEHWPNQGAGTTNYGVTTGFSGASPIAKGAIEVIEPAAPSGPGPTPLILRTSRLVY